MPTPTGLFYVNPSDDQSTFTQKFNYNMDLIWSLGGGPPGLPGNIGGQGVPGSQGLIGQTGPTGTPGTHWYVEATDPNSFGPITPAPNPGDLWLDTTTQAIWEYNGSPGVWTTSVSLTVAGVFRTITTDPNQVAFSTPLPGRKLVISPIDYEAFPGYIQDGTHKLKVIGTPGQPIVRYGVVDNVSENGQAYQSYVQVTQISSTEYTHEIINPSGDMLLSASGTSLNLKKQAANISQWEFNANALKLQVGTTDRALSFFTGAPSGFGLHFGPHSVISATSDRYLSVFDSKTIGIGDIAGNPVTGDIGARRLELITDALGATAGDEQRILRLRAAATSGTPVYSSLTVRTVRQFADAMPDAYKSSETRIEGRYDDVPHHFIAFGGGASASANLLNPSFRLGYGGTVNSGYYFAADQTGRMLMSSNTRVLSFTGGDGSTPLLARLTIEAPQPGATSGTSVASAIHIVPTSPPTNQIFGITAGFSPSSTGAQYGFEYFAGQHNLHMGAGSTALGGLRTMQSVFWDGKTRWWSYSNSNQSLLLEPGARWVSGTLYPNELILITSDLSGTPRSIILATDQTTTSDGDGFVGVGSQFSEAYTLTNNFGDTSVYTGPHYKTIAGQVQGNGFTKNAGAYWKSVTTAAWGAGTQVALGKPQSVFHAYGSFTFGSRDRFDPGATSYAAEIGLNSFVHGQYGRAAAPYSAIIAGRATALVSPTPTQLAAGPQGHNILAAATGSVIIGWDDVSYTMSQANRILLAASTVITSRPGFTLNYAVNESNGNLSTIVRPALTVAAKADPVSNFQSGGIAIDYTDTIDTVPFLIQYKTGSLPSNALVFDQKGDLYIQSGVAIDPIPDSSGAGATYALSLFNSDPAGGFDVNLPNALSGQTWTQHRSQLFVGNNRSTDGAAMTLRMGINPNSGIDISKFAKISTTSRNVNLSGTIRNAGLIIQPGHLRNINVAAASPIGGHVFMAAGTSSKKISGTNEQAGNPGTVYVGVGLPQDVNVLQEISPVAVGLGTPVSRAIYGKILFRKSGSSIATAVTGSNTTGIWSVTGLNLIAPSGSQRGAFAEVSFTTGLLVSSGNAHVQATVEMVTNPSVGYIATPFDSSLVYAPITRNTSTGSVEIGFQTNDPLPSGNWEILINFTVVGLFY